jgi:predicted RNase H-like nuclease (RuvC/YqgF family)
MESLQEQIIILQEEVRYLRYMIEILFQKLLAPNQELHRDVLPDRASLGTDRSEITLEWQVRRLTAQLTTAYNRIAALEEELMHRRHR